MESADENGVMNRAKRRTENELHFYSEEQRASSPPDCSGLEKDRSAEYLIASSKGMRKESETMDVGDI